MWDKIRVKKAMKIIEEDLSDAEQLFEKNKDRDCIQKLFQVYENCLNAMKDMKNGRPLSEHEAVSQQFNYYFELSIFKKDYSETHKRLDKLRKQAAFGPYTKFKTKPADMEEIRGMLEEARDLAKETRQELVNQEKKEEKKERFI